MTPFVTRHHARIRTNARGAVSVRSRTDGTWPEEAQIIADAGGIVEVLRSG
jgi:hypothetical protein